MTITRSRVWKTIGIAGLLGVAATGVVVARDQRRRRTYTPDEIRARLRERLDAADPSTDPTTNARTDRG